MDQLSFFSFFTKYSLLDDYGFASGLWNRALRKLIPKLPPAGTFELFLIKSKPSTSVQEFVKLIRQYCAISENRLQVERELDQALRSLSFKIIEFGYDHRIKNKFQRIGISDHCYDELLNKLDDLSTMNNEDCDKLIQIFDDIETSVVDLRRNKRIIGTSLHLTLTTRRILSFLGRVKQLVNLKKNIESESEWTILVSRYLVFNKKRNSLSTFFISHIDLLALEVVEHTSQKGERYVADTFAEYKGFFKKGLLGGAIIAIFALVKISFGHLSLNSLEKALLYSLNYSACFIIVKQLGGVIATKQPAMTASTIIKYIDRNDDLHIDAINDIILLFRKVSKSQFISLIGNFLTALILSIIIAFILQLDFLPNPLDASKSEYLLKQVSPISGGGLFYAAIAGFFLSISGLISGYFDNRVVASDLPFRIINNQALLKFVSEKRRKKIAHFVDKKLGVWAGNISLGFFLGTAFLLSYILPFDIDIRHIAFSSANVGYAIMNGQLAVDLILFSIMGVLLIGVTNFFVSFSITLIIALKSRKITIRKLGELVSLSLKDIIKNPLDYLIFRKVQVLKPQV